MSEADKAGPEYVAGISCLHCIGEKTDEQRARYAERQKQAELARQRRSATHVGPHPPEPR